MLVLDTNHFREIALRTVAGARLQARIDARGEAAALTVISGEETLRGWLARVAGARTVPEQVSAYRQLSESIRAVDSFPLLPWDREAAVRFQSFRSSGVRIGTLDLRIACITLEHDATLLTRNTSDFVKVPGLRFENWLD